MAANTPTIFLRHSARHLPQALVTSLSIRTTSFLLHTLADTQLTHSHHLPQALGSPSSSGTGYVIVHLEHYSCTTSFLLVILSRTEHQPHPLLLTIFLRHKLRHCPSRTCSYLHYFLRHRLRHCPHLLYSSSTYVIPPYIGITLFYTLGGRSIPRTLLLAMVK